jgi:hypothetical protein
MNVGVFSSAFRDGDVFIDFPYEEVMFRFEKSTGKVYRKFYGSSYEDEVPRDLKLYGDARMAKREHSRASRAPDAVTRSAPRNPRQGVDRAKWASSRYGWNRAIDGAGTAGASFAGSPVLRRIVEHGSRGDDED